MASTTRTLPLSTRIPLTSKGLDGQTIEIFHSELANLSCEDVMEVLADQEEFITAETYYSIAVSWTIGGGTLEEGERERKGEQKDESAR